MVFESDATARAFVNAHAINNNFAVKNGVCNRKSLNTGKLPLEVGTKGDNGITRQKVARSMLCDCPWRVRFKRQFNDSWILTELAEQHDGHQIDATMFDLVQHSSASFSTIAPVLNSNYGLSLLGRDVYNRTYDNFREYKSPSARFIETLRDEGYIYSVKLCFVFLQP
ncbi:hypothetical protein V1520DRAFT_372452 [Lipomyces starkeyi]